MIRLFSRAVPMSDYLSAVRQIQANDVIVSPPRVVYAEPEPFPTREEAEAKLAAAEILAEERWRIQEAEKEREAIRSTSPRQRVVSIRRVGK